jgi:hypothetical protein
VEAVAQLQGRETPEGVVIASFRRQEGRRAVRDEFRASGGQDGPAQLVEVRDRLELAVVQGEEVGLDADQVSARIKK